MNIEEALTHSTTRFKEAGIGSAALDARLLLSYILNKTVEYLLLNHTQVLTTSEQKKFLNIVDERYALKPLAYILGYKEFYGRVFKLNDRVLIPRPDTEILIDAVLPASSISDPHILELGCGSGCIIISLLLEILQASGVACDINLDATGLTRDNAILYNVGHRLEVIQSNWFENIKRRKFDIIVCNPPYISQHERPLMSKETLLYEPSIALFAGDEGLAAYKIIASEAARFLQDQGKLFLEIGFNQMENVKEIFTSQGFTFKKAYNDLNNHYRVLYFTLCDLKTINL